MNRNDAEPARATQTHARSKSPPDDENDAANKTGVGFQISVDRRPPERTDENHKSVSVGLIDRYRFTLECLTRALDSLHPAIQISSFTSILDCIDAAPIDFDLIIYHFHGSNVSDTTMTKIIATINQAFPTTPVLILSDADRAQHQPIMRSNLENGAQGFVPTQTAGLPIISAAISLVSAGGTFVPADLTLAAPQDNLPGRPNRLTARQGAVFTRLRVGKANKVIAYELGMCESTVKVHVRNIMRRVGVTNRTQAAYKGLRFSSYFQIISIIEI